MFTMCNAALNSYDTHATDFCRSTFVAEQKSGDFVAGFHVTRAIFVGRQSA